MKPFLYFTKKIYTYSGKVLLYNFVGMILISLLDGVGIFLLIPLINVSGIFEIGTKEIPYISFVFSFFENLPNTLGLLIILSIYVMIVVVQSIIHRHQLIQNAIIQQGFVHRLREETYCLLLQVNWGYFITKRKSDIIKTLTTEIGKVRKGTNLFIQFISSQVFSLIQVGVALLLSPKLTIFVLIFGTMLLLFSRYFIKKSYNLGKDSNKFSRVYIAGITDHLNGFKEIKSNNIEETHINWFRTLCNRIEENSLTFTKLKTSSQLLYKIMSAILIAIFVFIAVKMFKAQSAQLMLIIIIFSRLWPTFSRIQSDLEKLSSYVPSFEELINLQKQCVKEREFTDQYLDQDNSFTLKDSIKCKDVCFRYSKTNETYALKNVNVTIPCNQMTAIVGPSGAGKSTLVDLLMGLNKPEKGIVMVDGKELTDKNILSLRRSISYISQDPFLFNTSLRENFTLVSPNSNDGEIWEALEVASAFDFVKRLPQGLDTIVGDRGIWLSGGERQRIVLARALLRKPSILVLDEATSALDTENEFRIQETLCDLKGKITIIVIAHRLSTIKNADQVIVLENGEVIQNGGYKQLENETKGMFRRLVGEQTEVGI
ncbi:ABC transporter ATP-binding protein [Fredinandcohnia humi]